MSRVKVEQGWLEGKLVESAVGGQFYSFKGVPYAVPPIGKLRFKAPLPPVSWHGVRKATEHGPNCPQYDIFSSKVVEGNEDCLHLNVYSPNLTPQKLKPVMFFIHGGGFKSSSGDDSLYGADFLIDNDVVLVTINYRLEVLGFLCLDIPDVPGNAGLKDQVAALKWVNKNISNFGGDPNNITVFGESAGGKSAALHMLSPMSKGLFQKAIVMSGVPFSDWSIPFKSQKRAFILGRQLGLTAEDPKELLEYLQNLPITKLLNTNPCVVGVEQAINNNDLKMFHFTPVKETNFGQEAFLLEDPLEALKRGITNNVPTMIGYTSNEGLYTLGVSEPTFFTRFQNVEDMVVPRKILYQSRPKDVVDLAEEIKKKYFTKPVNMDDPAEFVKLVSDLMFVYDILKYISLFKQYVTDKFFFYKFSANSERNFFGNQMKYNIKGTSHLDDLLYLFNAKALNLPINKNAISYKMIQHTCKLFTNFAKFGNPTPDESLGVTWSKYGTNANYLDIGEKLKPGQTPDPDITKFWDKIYKMAGGCYENYINWN